MRVLRMMAMSVGALAVAATPASADVWSKTYNLSGKPELVVDADDAAVVIVSRAQNQIDAHLTTVGLRIGSDVQIRESQVANRVEIDVRVPHLSFHLFGGSRSIRLELAVPRAADLDIHTGDGSINADPVSGNIRLDTGDGSISATGLSGDARLHSGDGSINATGLDGALDANSGDGRISVRGRFDSLTLRSGDGSIDATAADGSKIAGSWSVRTGDGSVTLRLPQSFAADLDAHTGDGSITLDFPVTVSGTFNRNTIRGKLQGGGPPLYVRSGDGSIRIEKL
ncbi:MAG TPA: DUF4097 family beta strand repeat-containing protein [Candidatus Acidoferrales bacterium]|nr:DUF4097 family beta strand repeat-containing protein [Candidatus Acidoferrales bacterium]